MRRNFNQMSGSQAEQLAQRLLAGLGDANDGESEAARVQRLLAHLLGFHWREDKPLHWRRYAWRDSSELELIDDFDCLGGLRRTTKRRTPIKKSYLYEYRFPEQETKLHVGCECCYVEDQKFNTTSIHSLDLVKGRVEIKLGPSIEEEPEALNLLPQELIPSTQLANAVCRYVEAWSRGDILSRAIQTGKH